MCEYFYVQLMVLELIVGSTCLCQTGHGGARGERGRPEFVRPAWSCSDAQNLRGQPEALVLRPLHAAVCDIKERKTLTNNGKSDESALQLQGAALDALSFHPSGDVCSTFSAAVVCQ